MKYNSIHKSKKYLKEIPENNEYNKSSNFFDIALIKSSPFLERPGKIKYAKMHSSANRPMHKIKEFSKYTNFCICCNLPIETKNVIEPFHFCDSIHSFSECGLGISLFFYFFRFSILCLIIVFISLALPLLIYNKYVSSQLSMACLKNSEKNNIEICKKYYVQTSFYNYTYQISIPFSSDSIYAYLEYAKQTTGTDELAKETLISCGVLNLLCGITIFVMNFFFFIILKRTIYKEKYLNCSPSDFTLFVGNLNNIINYYDDYCISKKIIIKKDEEKYKHFISFLKNKIISDKKNSKDIYDINICYKLKDFIYLEKQNYKINYQLIQIVNNSKIKKITKKKGYFDQSRRYFESICLCFRKKGKSIRQLLKSKEMNQNKLSFLLKNSKILTKNNFAGGIFITFNTIQKKEEYYSLYPHYFFGKIFFLFKLIKYYFCWCCLNKKEKKIFLRRKNKKVILAPEPEDIKWENIEYDNWFRIKRNVITNFITLILLLISFIIVLALTYLKEYLLNSQIFSKYIIKYGISLLITGAIAGINELFYYFLEKLTKREKHISMTKFYLSFSVKLTFYTFVSSGLVPLACNYIENGGRNEDLVDNMLVFFLCNSFITPLSWSFNIHYIANKIRIFFLEKTKNPDKKHNMNQKELNQLYQRPSMQVPYKYSYIAKTLLLSLFYISILPFGILISLLGFIFAYCMELYNFTHLYNRPEMINEEICLFYIEYFIINLFVFCLGICIFMKNVFLSDIWAIISLFIFVALSFIPFNKVLKFKFLDIPNPSINKISQIKYEDLYFSFYNDYQRQNPMTRIDGLKKYLNKLRINGFISEKVYKFAYINIDKINVMELYYHSKKNRNIIQTQKSIANFNNYFRKASFNESLSHMNYNNRKISNCSINNETNMKDEQLMSLIRNSIFGLNTGNFDEINKKLNYINIRNSNNKEDLSISNSEEKDEEIKDKNINEKNKDIILNQYKYPFLLNINQALGSSINLNVFMENENIKEYTIKKSNLNEIEEIPEEVNDSKEIKENSNYFNQDNSDSSSTDFNYIFNNFKKEEKKIEMVDLSENNKKKNTIEKFEMKNINEENNDSSLNKIKNKKEKYKINGRNNPLKEYFLDLNDNINGGDDDSNSS